MKTILLFASTMLIAAATMAQTATPPATGDGSSDNPYQIATLDQTLITGNSSLQDNNVIKPPTGKNHGDLFVLHKSIPAMGVMRKTDYETVSLEYCAAGSAATEFEYISNVAMGNIDNSSGRGAGGYQDFTGLSTDVEKGTQITVIITVAEAYPSDQILIWVDWDQNFDFFGANELVYQSSGAGFTSPHTANFTVPDETLSGPTRIRIRLHDVDYGPNNTPCGNSSYGEVEDYTVNVVSSGGQLPTVTTATTSNITQTSATSGGNVTSDGGAAVTARGVVWSTSQNPTIENNQGITADGTGTGAFTSNLTGLSPGTQYYVRAYATNSNGTAYGNQRSFSTVTGVEPAVVSTSVATGIKSNSVISGGFVSSQGGAEVTSRGMVWSTNYYPTLANNHGLTSDGVGTGAFVSNLTNLTPATTYYARAYAVNNGGTAYGNQIGFTTRHHQTGSTVVTLQLADPCIFLGISEMFRMAQKSFGFTIYPNPAGADFTLEIRADQKIGLAHVHLINIYGQHVKRLQVYSGDNVSISRFDTGKLPPGVYLVQIMRKNEILSKKLIVK